ncbi:hypothetical protein N0V84_008309 [Fusarium piperis]|uniref:Uncharacterized protein n=1 Tax=Fusarium piperis TaxID=1435070 RepID=A0A9W8W8D6_9HYPO|nr:hypothetical protein N0V84_008309 [Fusarium piperis]
MTGKPSYQASEIRFALELMLQDLCNEQISDAFHQRFGRPLTDNQIRYLRNKYGKDPDYGAPLVNRPASKKLKRRRVEPIETPRPEKRTRREVSAAPASTAPVELVPSPAVEIEPLKLLQEAHNSPSIVVETSTVKKEEITSPTPSQAYVLSPTVPATALPVAAQAQERSYVPRTTAGLFHQQQNPAWNTNFHPINSNFGQHWNAPVPQPATSDNVLQNVPQPVEVVQAGLMLSQTDGEAAIQQTLSPEEAELWKDTPRNTNRSVPQQPFPNYSHQTPLSPSLNVDNIDPRLFEESTDPVISLKQSFAQK